MAACHSKGLAPPTLSEAWRLLRLLRLLGARAGSKAPPEHAAGASPPARARRDGVGF